MAASVDQKLLRQTKFPSEFSQKVDMQKVNIEVMKKWIAGKISEILGSEDDVVIELCFNLLEGSRYPNIKVLQIQLTGFLEGDTAAFCKELWNLCLSAQSNPQGVPKELLEAKKLELIQEKIDSEKATQDTRRRQDLEKKREKEGKYARSEHLVRDENVRMAGQRDSRSPLLRSKLTSKEYRTAPSHRELEKNVHAGDSRSQGRSHREQRADAFSTRSRSRSPSRKMRRSSPLRSLSPSGSQDGRSRSTHGSLDIYARNGRRKGKYDELNGSTDRRTRHRSIKTPRSRSPRTDQRHRYTRDSYRVHARSKTPERREAPEDSLRRSPSETSSHSSNADDFRNSRTSQQRIGSRQHNSSRSASRSPRPQTKRRRSLERYQPSSRRRRNISSMESNYKDDL